MPSDSDPASAPIANQNVDPAVIAAANAGYWRRNVIFTLVLLVGWFVAGLGCGVLFAEPLNEHRLGGFPLGFWFAQQGAIIAFVALIFVYAVGMALLDRRYRRVLAQLRAAAAGGEL